MVTLKTKPEEPKAQQELADELFMSAADLRTYMHEMQMTKASTSGEGMDRAEKARQDLIKQLSEPLDISPEKLRELLQPFKSKVQAAAERGETELMVIRFPVALYGPWPRDQQLGTGLARHSHRTAAPSLRDMA